MEERFEIRNICIPQAQNTFISTNNPRYFDIEGQRTCCGGMKFYYQDNSQIMSDAFFVSRQVEDINTSINKVHCATVIVIISCCLCILPVLLSLVLLCICCGYNPKMWFMNRLIEGCQYVNSRYEVIREKLQFTVYQRDGFIYLRIWDFKQNTHINSTLVQPQDSAYSVSVPIHTFTKSELHSPTAPTEDGYSAI